MPPLEVTPIDLSLVRRAAEVIARAGRDGLALATAESCTGGLLAAVLSEAPGAGRWFQGGFVVYTKAQKTVALGVSAELLARETAVSPAVARAMAEGALARSTADVAIAVTGVAGPASDEDGNPVGLVHLAAVRRDGVVLPHVHRFGALGRGDIRYRTVEAALALLLEAIGATDRDDGKTPSRPTTD